MKLKKYISIFRIGWLDAIEYRTEFFVSVFSWGIRLFIALFLWIAVAEARGGSFGGYTLTSIIMYFFIVQILSSFVFSRVGFEIAWDIYRGDFINYMVKPINYIGFRMAHEMSKNVFRTVVGLLIFGTILFTFFGVITLPLWKIPLIIASVIGAYILNFCAVACISLSAFWIINATRIMFIYFGILTIFSGMMVPIDLFPPHLKDIFLNLPFAYIFYFPAKIIQAANFDPGFLRGLAIQWMYAVALTGLMILVYRRGITHFEGVGR